MSSGEVPAHDYRSRFEQYKALEAQKDALITVCKMRKEREMYAAADNLSRSFLTALSLSKGSVM
jgi:hypothetical protein